MPEIVAFYERESSDPETGEPGILRKEWRVRRVKDFTREELEAQWGPRWRESRPFAEYVLEHRYIRRGKEEPWEPFEAATTIDQVLQYVDAHATPIHPKLKKLWAAREAEQKVRETEAEAKRLVEIEAEERERRARKSNEAFLRMMENPKFRAWGERWNEYILVKQKDRAFLDAARENEGFMRAYRAIFDAVTVPAKVKAIRMFLEAFGGV
ncbi:MAG: hypothetical protein A3E01_07910 [Gammaproteobacteria bacterium RIFCSPHIGHO2_12_FULL_63_22]|nr:MAG: hypothetical protein A3E01_07910 [Gammaproteobacteria bacterium RIFCSPHIGHO2_12_FULL_63_22]